MIRRVLLAAAGALAGALAAADVVFNYDDAGTDRWRCRLCPFDRATGAESAWTVGAARVDGGSSRFGRDNGLDGDGLHADVQADYRLVGESGRWLRFAGADLGLDARHARLSAGGPRYEVDVVHQDLPRNISRIGRTPYRGTDALSLPSGWVRAFDAGGLTELAAASRPFDNATRRRRDALRVGLGGASGWRVEADYARETKTGTRETFADMLYQSVGLPAPVRHRHESLGARLRLERPAWLVAATLRNARFRNGHRALTWENAYHGWIDEGRKGLAPDNDLTTASLLASAALGERTRLHGSLAWGDGRQDAPFLPYTANANLDAPPLPADSLNGRARTFASTLALVSRFAPRWRLDLRHRAQGRWNRSPALVLAPVIGDLYSLGPALGRPRDFAAKRTSARLGYRLGRGVRLAAGAERRGARRTYAEIAGNDEDVEWIELAARGFAGMQVRLKATRASRDAMPFRSITDNNPRTRRFHQAGREQTAWRVTLRMPVAATGLNLGMHAERRDNRYPDSLLGLRSDRDRAVGAELDFAPREDVSVSGFYTRQETASAAAGSALFAAADWHARTADAVATAGITVAARKLWNDALDITASYVDSDGAGRYVTETDGERSAFPALASRHRALDLRVYLALPGRLAPWAVVARYQRQRYAAADWALVGADAMANVLAFGRRAPNDDTTLVGLAIERRL